MGNSLGLFEMNQTCSCTKCYALVTKYISCMTVYVSLSEDSSFTKGMLSLLINLHVLYKSPASLLLELCQDIHSEVGDIDQVHTHFAVFCVLTV